MRRRAVLAALTGSLSALSGCGTLDGDGTSRPTFGVERRTTDANDADAYDGGPPGSPAQTVTTHDLQRRVTLFGVSTGASGLAYDVGLLGREGDGPIRLWIALTNESDTEREVEFDGAVPFGAPIGVSVEPESLAFEPVPDGPRLWLVPAADPAYESVRPDATVAGCWRAAGPVNGVGLVRSVTLEPGEHVGQAFELLTPPGADDCLPRGLYRFESADERLGFSLSVGRPPTGPPPSELDGVSLPAIEAETTWFHDAHDTIAPVYLRPASESFAADRTVAFTLHNNSTEPVTTIGHQLLRSNGTAWLPVLEADPTLSRNQELVPPGGTTLLEVGFGEYGQDASLRELRAGHYAVRLRLDADGADPGAVVSVTEGTLPTLTTTARFRTLHRSNGVVTLDRDRGDQDGAVVELEHGGQSEATVIPLERVLRFPALQNVLASLRDDGEATTVRLLTDPYRARRAAATVRKLDGPDDAFAYRGQAYTIRVST